MPWSKLSNLIGRQRHRPQELREDSTALIRPTIIVPLYIYPESGAWTPLHDSIRQNENTHFLLIVNPGNGPGPDTVPDANYLSEIPKLTGYSNVDVLGYVHINFGQRDLPAVINDICTYSRWAEQTQHPGLTINGIFVDETPWQWDARAEKYLSKLTEFAKDSNGFAGKKLIIHNPGCIVSPAYMALADITVVFEDTWQTFKTRCADGIFDLERLFQVAIPAEKRDSARKKLAIMIHSVPSNMKPDEIKVSVKQARQIADSIFITDLDTNYYSNWSPNWTQWVKRIVEV